jgi:glutamine amidotransferase
MCLAIYKPRGVQISRKYLEAGYDENPHGCGFAYAKGGHIIVSKNFSDFGGFYKAIRSLMPKHPMLIHFRWATHGSKTVANTHPFVINSGAYAVIHNGCINIKTKGDKSDTRTFCEQVLEPMFKLVAFDDSALRYLVEGNIGCSNKVAVLRADGKHVIFNEHIGHWHKGAWFSNHGYVKSSRWESSTTGWLKPTIASAKDATEAMWNRLGYNKSAQGQSWPDVITEPDPDEIAAEAAQAETQPFPDYEGRAYGAGSL